MGVLTGGNVRTAVRNLRRNKMRSLLTMLGIIIGVSSVVLVVGIGTGIKHQIGTQTDHLGKDLITVRPGRLFTKQTAGTFGMGSGLADLGLHLGGSLTPKDISAVHDTPGVSGAAPLSIVNSGVVSSERKGTYNMLVIGTNSELPGILHQSLAYGSFFDDDGTSIDKVVLGSAAAQALFDEHVPLGQTLSVLGHQFIVVGILDEFQSTPFSADADFNDAIFIPYPSAQAITNDNTPIYEILARPSNPAATDAAVRQISDRLSSLRGGSNDFSVLKQDQTLAVTNQILQLITFFIIGVAAIAMLVGGVGIMNVMLVSVTERMHEIGIRKALGATNRQITMQFLAEAMVLSATGGCIGIVLSFAVEGILWLLVDLTPGISWQLAVAAFLVSVAAGILFGSIPALKAARKEPIAALRNE
jgi:putative ABC transport system permease protein